MADDEQRIDDLARSAGVATTTVRLYQHRGLLPPPRLEGRVGWYGRRHLDRLRLIARLQEDGHSLAGIGRLLDGWGEGAPLAEVVGEHADLATLLAGGRSVELSPAELAERLPSDALTADNLAAAVDAGLVELTDDGRFLVPDRRFLDVGPAVAALGLPSSAIVDEWQHLSDATDAIAERFVAVFERHVLPDGAAGSLSPAEVADAAASLERLRRLADQVVQIALDRSVADAARRRLPRLAGILSPDPDPPTPPPKRRRR